MLKKKLKERDGSSLVMVIFLLTLISVSGIMITNQIGNQLKFTNNRYDNIQAKYISEAGIERTIKEACNQLSNSITYQASSTESLYYNKNINLYKSSNIDNMKSELSNVKKSLNSISDKINAVDLNNINSKIDSIETANLMTQNIDDIRNYILNIAINSNNYNEIEGTINLSIQYLYNALNFAQIEKNKDIEPVALSDSKEDGTNNGQEINALLYGNKFGNSFGSIGEKLNNVNNNPINEIRGIISWQNEEAIKIQTEANKIYEINFRDPIIEGKLKDLMHEYRQIFYDKEYENLSSKTIVNQLAKINKLIEENINEINKIQLDLNKLYLNNINNVNNTNKDRLISAMDNVLKGYDNVKYDFRWLQKKLGLNALNSDSSTDSSTDSNENYILKLQLENYNKEFDGFKDNNREYKYEISYNEENILEKIEKDIIVQKDSKNNITNIEDIEVNIISSAYKKSILGIYNLVYKIESKVIFKVDVQDDLKVKYEIKSYEKIPLK